MKYAGLLLKETADKNEKIITPQQGYEVFKERANLAQEIFSILTLNTKHQIIHERLICIGIVNECLVHPREVFRTAIMDGATSIILSHNHPSGDPTPSVADIKITKQLIESGKIIGIEVIDHVIIGDNGNFVSLRETEPCLF